MTFDSMKFVVVVFFSSTRQLVGESLTAFWAYILANSGRFGGGLGCLPYFRPN